MYRASKNAPRTAWARHLDQVMRDREWSRVRLFEEVGAELGYGGKSRSGMLPILEDREPTEAQAEVLRRHFGEPFEVASAPTGATEPTDPLVAAILAQTEAITALVEELRLSRAGQVEATEIAFQALGALGVVQGRAETPDGSAHEADAGTPR